MKDDQVRGGKFNKEKFRRDKKKDGGEIPGEMMKKKEIVTT